MELQTHYVCVFVFYDVLKFSSRLVHSSERGRLAALGVGTQQRSERGNCIADITDCQLILIVWVLCLFLCQLYILTSCFIWGFILECHRRQLDGERLVWTVGLVSMTTGLVSMATDPRASKYWTTCNSDGLSRCLMSAAHNQYKSSVF